MPLHALASVEYVTDEFYFGLVASYHIENVHNMQHNFS